MRLKECVLPGLLGVLLTGCAVSRTEVPSKPEVKTSGEQAEAGKKAEDGKPSVSAAELLYVKALREPDKAKRIEMFKSARRALLDEAEKNDNMKAHLLLGYMADLGQGMPSDGIQAARHYRIAADSGMPEAKIALAEFWRRNEIFLDEAVKQITGIPGYEENPNALCTLGAIYYAMYENEKGFSILKKAYTSPHRTANTRLEVLKILHGAFEKYFKGNNLDAALLELKRTDELEPDNYLTAYLMGLVEFRRGHAAEAEKLFNLSWQRNPAMPETYRELAFLKVRSSRFDAAVDDIKVAYAVSGRKPEFERALLEIYLLAKRMDDLLQLTDRILADHPERKEIRLIRISILQLKKEYQKAYDDLMILLKDPKLAKDPAIQETFANISSMLGKYADAVQANEAILKQGFRPVPALNLAELYIVSGQFDKAAELLRHPDLKDRKEPLIRCIVPYLEACALLAGGKNADDAARRFKAELPAFQAARKEPGEWDVTMFKTWLKDAALPETVKKTIAEWTDAVEGKKSPQEDRKDQKDQKKSPESNLKTPNAVPAGPPLPDKNAIPAAPVSGK